MNTTNTSEGLKPRRLTIWQVATLGVCVLSLSSCGLFAAPADDTAQPTETASAPASSPVAAVEAPKDVAIKVMDLFARPNTPERRWFIDLLPYLSEEYADEAQYIDPARVPFTKVQTNPTTNQDEHMPQMVIVRFSTNDGPWQVVLVQDQDGEPWLVQAIEPDQPVPEFTP
ncbi:hypothetical protein FQ154_18580 [Paeniglutamicibacter gangotriensis]|uniref:DUF4864 domain-containing protein n=1 Tax=Paeniglutamicibacter gangotriensis TaxID=254787 RepID=A0A5B0E518_9MICC|nr:hypothetical protein [Paeniglutamicibacter gangotriensis]KAA0973382.1 hypothetical protein FQ154_18580 [Paeniglutamicibacter gangotriensis]